RGTINERIAEHPSKKGTMIIHAKARPPAPARSGSGGRAGKDGDDPRLNDSVGQAVGRGKDSLTDYEVLEDFGIYSWIQFRIHTGRTHQIRVHARHIGHPIVCDELYGEGKPVFLSLFKRKFKLSKEMEEEKPLLNRLALHAFHLRFFDLKGKVIDLEAPLPKD